jgi:hypothetical protein
MGKARTRLAVTAATAAAAVAVGLAAPVQASASGITLPTLDVQGIVNCVIAVVDQLAFGGRPDPSDCVAVPGGV